MNDESTDDIANSMLTNTFVYSVGYESCFPFIKFINKTNSSITTVAIDSEFHVEPKIKIPQELNVDFIEYIELLDIQNETTMNCSCEINGDLTINFEGGRKIIIKGTSKDNGVCEPWTMRNTETKKFLICQTGGNYVYFIDN